MDVKPFLEYSDLVQRLVDRGMIINDRKRCERKLAQVGYYRLSGYWFAARTYTWNGRDKIYNNEFQPETYFGAVLKFYLFDKNIRKEFMCAIERIEVYLRTIIAHEIGRIDPLAYKNKALFEKDAFNNASKGIKYGEWATRHERLLSQSKEECILSHMERSKPLPLWVAVEAWDFGLLSRFFSMLKGRYKEMVCARVGIDDADVLDNWLININGLRNRCAHHARFCNRSNPRGFKVPKHEYFESLGLEQRERSKLFGAIAVIWFLVEKIGPSSDWLKRMAVLIDDKPNVPGFHFSSMGFARDTNEFPRRYFPNQFN